MSKGDYQRWQAFYQRVTADVDTAATPAIAPRSANYQIWIQKITNGGTVPVTVADIDPLGVAAAILIAVVPADATLDFGPTGTPIRVGFRVDNDAPTSGRLHIEGYQKLAVATAASQV